MSDNWIPAAYPYLTLSPTPTIESLWKRTKLVFSAATVYIWMITFSEKMLKRNKKYF